MRVTLRPGTALPAPGEAVGLLAIMNPPPPPASPGAYDFSRDAYFESVGAVGLALRAPEVVVAEAPAPWRLRLTMRINAARWALTRRIVDTLGPETGGLAAAMTTGHEAFIPREQVDNLRAAGLAHIVSISGLHMAIVGGFAFAAARLGVAAWPWLALRVPGKKVAAVVGLAAVLGYLVLSGAPPPAERAAITASVAFAAILVDRQAISLHALALAAMGVLLIQPEAVTEPGFQMSFAATAALVALAGDLAAADPGDRGPLADPRRAGGGDLDRGQHRGQLRRRPGDRTLRYPALQPGLDLGPVRQSRRGPDLLVPDDARAGGGRGAHAVRDSAGRRWRWRAGPSG